jgi:hypothetical protein
MASGLTVSRSGPQRLFTVQTIHMGVCMHEGIDIGDIFFKDGDIEVSTYTVAQVTNLIKTATPARQAAFSFLTPSEFHQLLVQHQSQTQPQRSPQPPQPPQTAKPAAVSGFTVGRSQAPGRPYTVRTINKQKFPHSGVEIGHVFYKDGDNYVVAYEEHEIKTLLSTATPARQATFSFLPISELTNCFFKASTEVRGGPYIVTYIHPVLFQNTGTYKVYFKVFLVSYA